MQNCEPASNFICHSQKNLTCHINPLVYVTILDSYARRKKKGGEREKRIIGTLMGIVSEGSRVEVVDCFQVVHDEDHRGVLLAQDYHRKMVHLRQTVHPKEQVIGWFSCGSVDLDADTVSIHAYYRQKESLFSSTPALPSPIYLQIDTGIRQSATPIGITLYTTENTPCCENLQQFHQIAISKSVTGHEEEHAIMDMLLEGRRDDDDEDPEEPVTSLQSQDSFATNVESLRDLLQLGRQYVGQVLRGERKGDPEIGRSLAQALVVSELDDANFKASLSDAMKDTLMGLYLSNLSKTQIGLAEKITAILGSSNEN